MPGGGPSGTGRLETAAQLRAQRKRRVKPKRRQPPPSPASRGPGTVAAQRASSRATRRQQSASRRRLKTQVDVARNDTRRGRGAKADTRNVLRGAKAPTVAERRRALGARFPSGNQSALGVLLKRNEATKRRNEVLAAFDRDRGRTGLYRTGSPPAASREQRAIDEALGLAALRGKRGRRQSTKLAPALSVLNETLRPVRAVSGSADAALRGTSIPAGAKKGLIDNEAPLFGEVLRNAGVSPGVAGAVGFGLDVLTDPATYLTFGTSSVARQAAARASAQAERKARRAGMTPERAKKLGEVAAKRAAKGRPRARGIEARLAGKPLPGTVRPAAAVGRGIARVTPDRVKRGAATTGRQVNPRAVPPGIDRAQWLASRQAERESRAAKSQLLRRSQEKARVLRDRLDPAQYDAVIDALERRSLRGLPNDLHTTARELRDELRYQARVRRQAGVSQGTIGARSGKGQPDNARGYFPHRSAEALETPGAAIKGGASVSPGSTKRRTDPRRVAVINPARAKQRELVAEREALEAVASPTAAQAARRAELDKQITGGEIAALSTNVPLVAANYGAETAGAVATSNVVRELARVGKAVDRKVPLKAGESVYRIVGGKLPKKLNPKDKADAAELKRVGRGDVQSRVPEATAAAKKAAAKVKAKGGDTAAQQKAAKKAYAKKLRSPAGGKYVVLPDRIVDDALGRLVDTRSETGRAFDLVQGKWKRIATATPGFHIRNMIGDAQMGFLAQPAYTMPGNMAAAARALTRQTARETTQRRGFRPATKTDKSIKLAGRHVNLDDFLDDAVRSGVIRSGQVGRELEEFRHGTGDVRFRSRSGKAPRDLTSGKFITAGRSLNRGFQNREDLMRLATYKYGLEQGLARREAADLSMAFHIDYGDVSNFERTFARRAAPFWTFTARALPIHVKALVQKPGKFANVEKARQETAQAFGLQPDWQGDLPEYKQRAIPFGIKWGDRELALDAQLPISMLNELPTTLALGEYGAELRKFLLGLTTPFMKVPFEMQTNRSMFFRRDIQNAEYPLVAAPRWAMKLPREVRERLGIVPDLVDRRSGKKVAGWPGRIDYLVKLLPGLPYLANQLATEGSLRSGRSDWEKLPSALGVKTDPVDPTTTRIFELLDKSRELNGKINALGQRGKKGGRSSQSPEVRALHAAVDVVDLEVYKLSLQRKDAMPLRESQVPKKARRAAGASPGGASSGGFDFSTARPVTGGGTYDFSTARRP